jgi:hypothetical protein
MGWDRLIWNTLSVPRDGGGTCWDGDDGDVVEVGEAREMVLGRRGIDARKKGEEGLGCSVLGGNSKERRILF